MSEELFKALNDATRRAVLDELGARDGQTLFEICGRLAMKHEIFSSRQAVSQHLAVLEEAGLVTSARQGRHKYHYVNTSPLDELRHRWLPHQSNTPIQYREHDMRIQVTSVFVDDQAKAHDFYTTVLGFHVKHDIAMGPDRWLTVVSPERQDGPELLLEPATHPAVKPYRDALIADGIPLLQLEVYDVQTEYERLSSAGVEFTVPPTDAGTVTMSVFNDTCGNLVQLIAMK